MRLSIVGDEDKPMFFEFGGHMYKNVSGLTEGSNFICTFVCFYCYYLLYFAVVLEHVA